MIKETMTPTERVMAAINLEPYDRVPVAPHLNSEFPLRLKGRPTTDAYNLATAAEAHQFIFDLFDEVGGWDAVTLCTGGLAFTPEFLTLFAFFYGDTMRFPGADDRISAEESPPQFAEREILTPADYDPIIEKGWHRFCMENMERISSTIFGVPLSDGTLPIVAQSLTAGFIATRDAWQARGIPVISGTNPADPQMILSLMRTLTGFTMDLYRYPDKVKEVLKVISRDNAKGALDSMLLAGAAPKSGIPGIMMACERGSGTYYNLKVFEEFVWPYMKEGIEVWHKAGFVTTLHFDTDWTLNLPYLLELPRKSCIVELDSTTDIFKAKEILGDHMCIMGDIPPAISTLGTTDEMQEYCEKLIDVVGKDTGFILSTGCAVPPDTKLENYKMMINTAKNYPPPRSK